MRDFSVGLSIAAHLHVGRGCLGGQVKDMQWIGCYLIVLLLSCDCIGSGCVCTPRLVAAEEGDATRPNVVGAWGHFGAA